MIDPALDLANQAPSVAAATAAKLEKLGIRRRFDLVLHLPLRYQDETQVFAIAAAPHAQVVLVEGEVIAEQVHLKPRRQWLVQIQDSSGTLLLRFLHFYPSQQKQLVCGKRIRALGEIRRGFWGDEMIHPTCRDVLPDAPLAATLTPIYSTVSGVTQPLLRRLIHAELKTQSLSDTLPQSVRQALGLISFEAAVCSLHAPAPTVSAQQLTSPLLPAWQRLKFDELLAQQLSMRLSYRARRRGIAPAIQGDSHLIQQLLSQLPFALTTAQQRVIGEIRADLAQCHPMQRLLQGDVGSGKTVVAAITALAVIEAGYQVALMAPTELLAEQHYRKLTTWLAPLEVEVIWLCGSLKQKQKQQALQAIASTPQALLVGTHALFQQSVTCQRLGLIIVDEQHRFGVGQRLALKDKGIAVHQLMMSATPIPRTLAMSFYADLDISEIDELPPGRTPVVTKLINCARRDEVVAIVDQACAAGRQVYWVCPLIEESAALQLQTAVETHASLSAELVHWQIGLVHGRMKSEQKAQVMAAFCANELQILVATTVIEVGVDVPNASLMVIEHAERMGLAQLHQLRGRVGRGVTHSQCILMFDPPLSDLAKARLKAIYQHSNGFDIARQDLLIRGPGEFLGARQSGAPMLRFADIEEDLALLEQARALAPTLLQQWPDAVNRHLDRWLAGKEEFLKA